MADLTVLSVGRRDRASAVPKSYSKALPSAGILEPGCGAAGSGEGASSTRDHEGHRCTCLPDWRCFPAAVQPLGGKGDG